MSGFMCKQLNLAGMRVRGGLEPLKYIAYIKYRKLNNLPYSIPDILIIDKSQYHIEKEVYDSLTEEIEFIETELEALDGTLARLKMLGPIAGLERMIAIVLNNIWGVGIWTG